MVNFVRTSVLFSKFVLRQGLLWTTSQKVLNEKGIENLLISFI